MDQLTIRAFSNAFPGAELSCRECCSGDSIEIANHRDVVSASNPLGDDICVISCKCGLKDEVRQHELREAMKAWLITSVINYVCLYVFNTAPENSVPYYVINKAVTSEGIGAFSDGFWVNADMEYTKGSDCKYWVPPGKIQYIEKDEVVKRLSE